MKKILVIFIAFVFTAAFSGCSGEKQEIVITVPAGSMESFVFSEEVFEATKDKIIITAGAGFSDTSVTLQTEKVLEENAYEPTYLTHGIPIEMATEKGGWFRIGVSVQNPSEHDIAVSVYVQNIEIKIGKGG